MASMILLAGADKERFGKARDEMANTYISKKKDIYPATLESAAEYLSNYQDRHLGTARRVDNYYDRQATSFAQTGSRRRDMSKVRCHECGELGHMKRNCPRSRPSHTQSGDASNEDGNQSVHSERDGTAVAWSAFQGRD